VCVVATLCEAARGIPRLYACGYCVYVCVSKGNMLAGGFPRVLFSPCGRLFPPLWCVSPRGVRGLCPPAACGLSTPRVALALLSWDHLASFRASPRQTWAGSSPAAAGAPQLHASALQQRRRLTHRPANVKQEAVFTHPPYHVPPCHLLFLYSSQNCASVTYQLVCTKR